MKRTKIISYKITYPKKYINLINLFLKKRDVKQGGVEGFTTPFNFTINELKPYIINKKEIIEMLDLMKKKQIDIITHDKYIITIPIIEKYEIKKDKITIFDCSTEKLENFKEIINKILKY